MASYAEAEEKRYNWREHFTRAGTSDYGPRAENPLYEVTGSNGIRYTVQRHQWVLPYTHWGWAARPMVVGKKTVYGDTLEDVACDLGLFDEEEAR